MSTTHSTSLLATGTLLLMLAVSGCALTGSGVNTGDINLVSLEEEWRLGAQLENDLARELDLVNNSTLVGYVNRIGRRIVNQTSLGNRPWEFHVVDDPSANAFNIPGGHVYVHTGLIARADNTAELAGVMAHEIAHGVSRHGTERLTKSYGLNIVAGLLLGRNPAIYEQILAQIAGAGAIASFSRSDEREADQLGVEYMYEADYDPMGMASMFEELQREQSRNPNAVSQFFSTHPLFEDRIAHVRQLARRMPDKNLITTDGQYRRVQSIAEGYN